MRPRTLLVFTNPFGGHGTASEIYAHSVRPVLVAAGVKATIISTKSGGHASEYIKTHTDLDLFDGIVVVGGDGFFHEVVNALVQTGNNRKRVGLIPGGSTNTIVYSLHGTLDPGTAATHIVLGERMPLDLCRASSMDNKVCSGYIAVSTSFKLSSMGATRWYSTRRRWQRMDSMRTMCWNPRACGGWGRRATTCPG